jgi:hypothetical protein
VVCDAVLSDKRWINVGAVAFFLSPNGPHNPPYKHELVGMGWVPHHLVWSSSLLAPPAVIASRTCHPPYEQLLVGMGVGATVLGVVVCPC